MADGGFTLIGSLLTGGLGAAIGTAITAIIHIPTTNPFVSSLRFKIPICKPCLDTHIAEDLAGKPR